MKIPMDFHVLSKRIFFLISKNGEKEKRTHLFKLDDKKAERKHATLNISNSCIYEDSSEKEKSQRETIRNA